MSLTSNNKPIKIYLKGQIEREAVDERAKYLSKTVSTYIRDLIMADLNNIKLARPAAPTINPQLPAFYTPPHITEQRVHLEPEEPVILSDDRSDIREENRIEREAILIEDILSEAEGE